MGGERPHLYVKEIVSKIAARGDDVTVFAQRADEHIGILFMGDGRDLHHPCCVLAQRGLNLSGRG